MEEYIISMRNGASTVGDLIRFLQNYPPDATIWIGSRCGYQLDIFKGINEDGTRYLCIY